MAKRRKRKRSTVEPRIVLVPLKPEGARRVARVDEACAYGRISRRTLYRLIGEGKLKVYRHSARLMLIDLDSIDAFHNGLPEGAVCQR